VAAPPCGDPEAYTSLLDLALTVGATIVAAPLAQVTDAIGIYKGTAAIVPRGTDVPGLPSGRILAVGLRVSWLVCWLWASVRVKQHCPHIPLT
jgi:hypothetical protein